MANGKKSKAASVNTETADCDDDVGVASVSTASAVGTTAVGAPRAASADIRSRHGQQAYVATTLGHARESGTKAAGRGSMLEATYQANIQVAINCDASMNGVAQLFTLPSGVWVQAGQTIEGAAGSPVALITAEDPGVNTKTLFTAKALGATENALVAADTALDLDDTARANTLSVTVTSGAGGMARLALAAGVAVTGWK